MRGVYGRTGHASCVMCSLFRSDCVPCEFECAVCSVIRNFLQDKFMVCASQVCYYYIFSGGRRENLNGHGQYGKRLCLLEKM